LTVAILIGARRNTNMFWFAFPLRPDWLNISAYIYWSFALLLWRTVCSRHLPNYLFDYLLFWYLNVFWQYWGLTWGFMWLGRCSTTWVMPKAFLF
jgi:hypothetical protein